MVLGIVWLFFILGAGATTNHQAVDNFPSQGACEAFRLNVQQMLEQGASPGSRVSDCLSREITTPS